MMLESTVNVEINFKKILVESNKRGNYISLRVPDIARKNPREIALFYYLSVKVGLEYVSSQKNCR